MANYKYVQEVFEFKDGRIKNYLFEIKCFRNDWAHSPNDFFSFDDVWRLADTLLRFMQCITYDNES